MKIIIIGQEEYWSISITQGEGQRWARQCGGHSSAFALVDMCFIGSKRSTAPLCRCTDSVLICTFTCRSDTLSVRIPVMAPVEVDKKGIPVKYFMGNTNIPIMYATFNTVFAGVG